MVSKLNLLKGLQITSTAPIHDYYQIFFEQNIILNINNKCTWPSQTIVGMTVIDIIQNEKEIIILFSDGQTLFIDMSPSAYQSPEALELNIPGEPTILWRD